MLLQRFMSGFGVRKARTRELAPRRRPKVHCPTRGTFRQQTTRPRRRREPAICTTTGRSSRMLFQRLLSVLAVRCSRTWKFAPRCRPKVRRLKRGTFRQQTNRPCRRCETAISTTSWRSPLILLLKSVMIEGRKKAAPIVR